MLLQPQPTSPFPSPSSSFVPPPAQEAHEFAHKTTARMAAAKHTRSDSQSRRNSSEEKQTSPQPQPQPLPPPTPTLKRFSADSAHSLASSRPAPASPALSRHSSLLHAGSKKRLSTLSVVSTSTPPVPVPRPTPIKIRDFAYSLDDERHSGKWLHEHRNSMRSNEEESSSEDYFETSSQGDYESNNGDDPDEDDVPFVPGIYRALYAFEPEGTAEMALAEDQHVHVLGRGGGVGWVVVLKSDGDEPEQALVPEDYLELVKADMDLDDDDEDESVSATEAPQTPRALS